MKQTKRVTFIDCTGRVVRMGVCVKCGEVRFVCIYPGPVGKKVCNHCLYKTITEETNHDIDKVH